MKKNRFFGPHDYEQGQGSRMNRIRYLLIVFLFFSSSATAIIIRHDRNDQSCLDLAVKLGVAHSVIRYNKTDLAGTLIAPQWVLSAAHVAETLTSDHELLFGGRKLGIDKVIIHPRWLENGRPEDIALIRLKEPLADARPMRIYSGRDEEGMLIYVAGSGDYGTGLTGPAGNDGRLRAGSNRVDEASEDYLAWGFDDPRADPEEPTDMEAISGPGDSSGPAFIERNGEYFIVGISSAQSTKVTGGKEGLYGVAEYYTRVSSYADWIEKEIERQ